MFGLHLIERLVVAANVLATQAANVAVHNLACSTETILQADRVALGFESAQKFGTEPLQGLQIPRLQRRHHVVRQALGGAHEHVVEKMLHVARNRVPARSRDASSPSHRVAVGILLGVGLGVLVIVAALARIVSKRH
jgi:hypothetical protein